MKRYGWLIGLLFGSEAFAEGIAPIGGGTMGTNAMAQGLLLTGFGLIFYFFLIRPQSKRAKEHQRLLSGLQKEDEVITTGGMLGKITAIKENFFVVKIAEGVEVPVQKQAIATSVPKGTLNKII